MMRRFFRWMPAAVLGAALAACQIADRPAAIKPQERPAPSDGAARTSPRPSAESDALRVYYAAFQQDLLAQGLLRTDGGGIDTPFTARELAENFENIVFYDEYVRGGGLRGANGAQAPLRRWRGPVRVGLEFGPSVPASIAATDRVTVRDYTNRLARLTGHPVSMVTTGANFHVLVMGEDDRDIAVQRIRQIVPDITPASLAIFQELPRTIHCLVVAFSQRGQASGYGQAIALIRAEHPDLVRKSCYHEEMAQGMGLANDSPRARPSIFNDDDEFALLTTHDEMLLKMLYDPRLRPGMSADQARPIVKELATALVGGES